MLDGLNDTEPVRLMSEIGHSRRFGRRPLTSSLPSLSRPELREVLTRDMNRPERLMQGEFELLWLGANDRQSAG